MTIDQHNNSLQYVPWLVDKIYTDEDIYNMYGFTQEEIRLIDETLEKFERNFPACSFFVADNFRRLSKYQIISMTA